MKKLAAALLAATFVFAAMFAALVPVESSAQPASAPLWSNNGRTVIDTDGSDGYTGDYVVIYNPGMSSGGVSTGNMSGLIETEINPGYAFPTENRNPGKAEARPVQIPFHPEFDSKGAQMPEIKPMEYVVGDTRTFSIMPYNSWGSMSIEFEVLAVGQYCYVWTPTSSANNLHPLDEIDPTFGQIVADEFDSKYPLMEDAFGEFYDPEGEGRVNLMYYNIDDGWQPGEGYVAGFFYSGDYYTNNAAMINIDTYPGVEWETVDGEYRVELEGTFNTLMHEMQHLINDNVSPGADLWLNEMKSAAAEEIVYPGSSVSSRIHSWNGESYTYLYDETEEISGLYAKPEYPASSDLHSGSYFFQWDDSDYNVYYTYAQFSLMAQYLYSQAGTNTIFRAMSEAVSNGMSSPSALAAGMAGTPMEGLTASELVRNFRIALVANDNESNNGLYGFRHQEGYNPAEYYNMDNLFDLLSPCVFTTNQGSIEGGGAIVIKPVGGVYNPPAGASGALEYIGVSIGGFSSGSGSIPTPPAPHESGLRYEQVTEIESGCRYIIVAERAYAMGGTFVSSNLASHPVEIAEGAIISSVPADAVWQFDSVGSSNYSIKNVEQNLYLGSTSSGYPQLVVTPPNYSYTYDGTYLYIPSNVPSSYPYIQGDSGGFEFYGQDSASQITLFKEIQVDPEQVSIIEIWPDDLPMLLVGDTYEFIAVVSPSTALDKELTWTSSDDSIATVDAQGVVTGTGHGTVTITATANNGVSDSIEINVVQPMDGAALEAEIIVPAETPELTALALSLELGPDGYDPAAIDSINWELHGGYAELTVNETDPTQATLRGLTTGNVRVYACVTNTDGTYAEATADIMIRPGEVVLPDSEYKLVETGTLDTNKEYVIATMVDGEYYALSASVSLGAPFAPTGKLITVTEDGGETLITSAPCSFDMLEWNFATGESGYIINRAGMPGEKLVASTRATIELADPYYACCWNFDGNTLRQSKITAWPNMVYDIANGIFTAADAANMDDDSVYSKDIYLFEKTQSAPPTYEPPTSTPPTSEPPTSTPPTSEPPTSTPPTSEPPAYELGDVNRDGSVNTGDATMVLRYVVNLLELDDEQIELGDVNFDGITNTGDAAGILRMVIE